MRRTRAKHYYDRNLGGTPHDAIQPGQWLAQHKHLAWPHGTVEKVSSPRSYPVVTPPGETHRTRVEIRLASAPPADAKIFKSAGIISVHREVDQ